MIQKQGLRQIADFDIETGARELANRGNRVFLLPRDIKDKSAFFEGVRKSLPLDPPVVGDHSWDALSDSLWNGLDGVDASAIAIIWPGSTEMARAQPEDYEIAKCILSDLTESLADAGATVGNVKQVVVILA
ncbi:MAG TPA: barstar family protein [Blastocatellia bacterium]|nr:barstar family protein [Blastocatellia bacterium]